MKSVFCLKTVDYNKKINRIIRKTVCITSFPFVYIILISHLQIHKNEVNILLVYFQIMFEYQLNESVSIEFLVYVRHICQRIDLYVTQAQVLANNGDVIKAEHILHDILHRSPNHTEALHFLANVLGQLQRHQEVIIFPITREIYYKRERYLLKFIE